MRLASRGFMGWYPALSTIGAMIAGIPLAPALGAPALARVTAEIAGFYTFADIPLGSCALACAASNFVTAASQVEMAVNADAGVDFEPPIATILFNWI